MKTETSEAKSLIDDWTDYFAAWEDEPKRELSEHEEWAQDDYAERARDFNSN